MFWCQNKFDRLCNKPTQRVCQSCRTCSNKQRWLTVGMCDYEGVYLNPAFISTKLTTTSKCSLLSHPPVVYDGDEVAGHHYQFSGFSKLPCCLHLHWFCLWMDEVSETCLSAAFYHPYCILGICCRPLPPWWWAGQNWVCQQGCRPSTSSWQRTAPEDNLEASPDARPPAPHATGSVSQRVNDRRAKALSHRQCIGEANHIRAGTRRQYNDWHGNKYERKSWQACTCRPDRPNQGSSQ